MARRAYLYFVLTFLIGIVAGGVGVYFYGLHSGLWSHEFDQQRIVRRMTRDFSLDGSQVQKLTQIIEEYAKKRKGLEQKNQPEFDALHNETRVQVRQILNAEQLAKFNEHVRRSDERRKQKSP